MLINESLIIKALDAALSTGADFAEVFVEESLNNSISMVDGKVDSVGSHLVSGVGIRAYRGLQSASASSSDLSADAVLSAARSVAAVIGDSSRILPPIRLTERVNTNIHRIEIVPSCVPLADKVELLGRALSSAKAYSPLVSQVTGSLIDVDRKILVANSDGLLTGDRQIRTRMAASAVASRSGESQTGSCSPGRRMGLEMFTSVMTPEEIGTEAARQAVVNIEAGYIDSGVYSVAIENGFGGVIFHESCGHSLEATSVAYGLSEFAGKKGQKIANECVTAIDDGTIPNAWGSLNIDDEGTPTQRKVLIENGILKRYMVDRFNGRRMGEPSSGSARRQSYSFTPTSRMTNTFIAPGEDSDVYGIWEIVSNSLIIPPCQYGILNLHKDGSLSYHTDRTAVSEWAAANGESNPDLLDFSAFSSQYLRTVIKQQIYREIDGIPDYIRDIMVDFYAELYEDYYAGHQIRYSEKKKEQGYLFWDRFMNPSILFRQVEGMMRDGMAVNGQAEIPNPIGLRRK